MQSTPSSREAVEREGLISSLLFLVTVIGSEEWHESALGKFRWNIKKRLFTERVVDHWNSLPREGIK